MRDSFTIKIGDETLEVKELDEENYSDAFEIWKGSVLQFIIVPAIMNSLKGAEIKIAFRGLNFKTGRNSSHTSYARSSGPKK